MHVHTVLVLLVQFIHVQLTALIYDVVEHRSHLLKIKKLPLSASYRLPAI